jgi:hypothetical protein
MTYRFIFIHTIHVCSTVSNCSEDEHARLRAQHI